MTTPTRRGARAPARDASSTPTARRWIVRPGLGLVSVAASEAETLLSSGDARPATARDLDIGGVVPSQDTPRIAGQHNKEQA